MHEMQVVVEKQGGQNGVLDDDRPPVRPLGPLVLTIGADGDDGNAEIGSDTDILPERNTEHQGYGQQRGNETSHMQNPGIDDPPVTFGDLSPLRYRESDDHQRRTDQKASNKRVVPSEQCL